MRGSRAILGSGIAALILCISAVGVVAQGTEDEVLAPASFTVKLGSTTTEIVAGDPRASGTITVTSEEGGIDHGLKEWYVVRTGNVEVVNGGGSWLGTFKEVRTQATDERTKQQIRRGKGRRPFEAYTMLMELAGQDGYAGLSLFLVQPDATSQIWGMIVPTDTLPASPGADASAPAEPTTG